MASKVFKWCPKKCGKKVHFMRDGRGGKYVCQSCKSIFTFEQIEAYRKGGTAEYRKIKKEKKQKIYVTFPVR